MRFALGSAAAAVLALLAALLWQGGFQARAPVRLAPRVAPPGRPESPAPSPPAAETQAPKPPPDPVPEGSCALDVSLFNLDTGGVASSPVQLWRLDAPADKTWTKGDKLSTRAAVGAKGATISGLPEGTYRLVCDAQRAGAEDPPAFTVQGPLTEVRFGLWMPRTFFVRLRLVDGRGLPVGGVFLSRRGLSWSWRSGGPAWVKQRKLRRPPASGIVGAVSIGTGAGDAYTLVGRPSAAPPPAEVYRLGPVREDTHACRQKQQFSATREEYSKAYVDVSGDKVSERTYLGVIVPVAPLLAHLSLPDGTPAEEAGASLSASSHALLLGPDTPADYWRHLPIEVTVELSGYRPLTYVWRPGEALPDRVLQPK